MAAISDYANQSITGIQAKAGDVGTLRQSCDQSTLAQGSIPFESEDNRLRARTSMQSRLKQQPKDRMLLFAKQKLTDLLQLEAQVMYEKYRKHPKDKALLLYNL